MTCISGINSKRTLPAKLAAGLALSAFLVLGSFVASADAQPRRDEHRDDRGRGGGGWAHGGGYYVAPPVVYGAPVRLCATAGGLRSRRRCLSAGRHHRDLISAGTVCATNGRQ